MDISTFFTGADSYGTTGALPSGVTLSGSTLSWDYDTAATYTDFGVTGTNGAGTTVSNLDSVIISSAVTNKLVNATDTNNGSWTNSGTNSSGNVVDDAIGSGQHYVYQNVAVETGTEKLYYEAMYIDHANVGSRMSLSGSFTNAIVNIQTGVVVETGGFDLVEMEDLGSGVWGITLTFTNRTHVEIRISMFSGTNHIYTGTTKDVEITNLVLWDV